MHVKRLTIVALMFALLGNSVAFAQAQVQKFKELSVHPKFVGDTKAVQRFTRQVRGQINGILAGQRPLDEMYVLPDKDKAQISNRNLLDAWFGQNLIPQMTQLANLGNLAAQRAALMTALSRTRPPAHQHLIQMIYTKMSELASSPDYHPAVRYNAILTIGLLNENESGNFQAPKPLAAATTFLLQQYKATKTDVIRLGALVGLLRHVEMDRASPFLPAQAKQQILALSMALVNQDAPPKGRELSGHTWMRRRAIDVLAAAGFDAPDGSVLGKITSIIGDAKAPLSLRLTAAQSLARFRLAAGAKIDTVATAQKLGALAVTACRAEAGRVTKRRTREAMLAQRSQVLEDLGDGGAMEASAGGDAAQMAAMMTAGDGDDGTTQPVIELLSPADRRVVYHSTLRIRSQLFAVYQGLGSEVNKTGLLAAAAAPAEKAAIKKISQSIVEIVRAMDGKPDPKIKNPPKLKAEMNLDAVLKAVNTKVVALQNQLPAAAVAPQNQAAPTQKTGAVKKKSDEALLRGGTE